MRVLVTTSLNKLPDRALIVQHALRHIEPWMPGTFTRNGLEFFHYPSEAGPVLVGLLGDMQSGDEFVPLDP